MFRRRMGKGWAGDGGDGYTFRMKQLAPAVVEAGRAFFGEGGCGEREEGEGDAGGGEFHFGWVWVEEFD